MNALRGIKAVFLQCWLPYLRRLVLFILALSTRVLYLVDLSIQRLITRLRISQLAPAKLQNPNGLRVFGRICVLLVTFTVTILSYTHHYDKVVHDVEIPVLGSAASPVFGYYPPIGNNFRPQVPYYNVFRNYRPRTPLLIPYTRNQTMMQQTVLSYIAAGWPRADIILVDNSGTMDANPNKELSPSNPYYLDYDMFRQRYGISIIQTPTLLNFAQLQNFMLRIALGRNWAYYFWSHMDIAVLGAEEVRPYKSFYHRVVDVLDSSGLDRWAVTSAADGLVETDRLASASTSAGDREAPLARYYQREAAIGSEHQAQKKVKRGLLKPRWGVKFFAYDYLTLVNVQAWKDTGTWDTFIPYYNTDCDFYQRMNFAGYRIKHVQAGHVYDLADAIPNPEAHFFAAKSTRSRPKSAAAAVGAKPEPPELNSGRYQSLKFKLEEMMDHKLHNPDGRNLWQRGGSDSRPLNWKGKPVRKAQEPWSYDPKAFQAAWWATADAGRVMYIKKWGTLDCDLEGAKKSLNDMWLTEYVEPDTDLYNDRKRQEKHRISELVAKDLR